MDALEIRSYAKINWTIDVLYRRPDGYHELRTIYQTVSLFDTLRIKSAPSAITVECDNPGVPGGEGNLAYKAARMLREASGCRRGAEIHIQKRIPMAGGLGGGSSNAAAALIGLGRLWELAVPAEELHAIAAAIGSDVPFFLVGGTALGVGRGEEVYPLDEIQCDRLLLVNPGIEVSTAEAYGGMKRLTSGNSTRIMPFTLLAANGIRKLPLEVKNDLEESVLVARREIEEIKLRLMDLGARQSLMSGSGATVFGVFDNLNTLARAREHFEARGIWCEHTATVSRGEIRSSLCG